MQPETNDDVILVGLLFSYFVDKSKGSIDVKGDGECTFVGNGKILPIPSVIFQ